MKNLRNDVIVMKFRDHIQASTTQQNKKWKMQKIFNR